MSTIACFLLSFSLSPSESVRLKDDRTSCHLVPAHPFRKQAELVRSFFCTIKLSVVLYRWYLTNRRSWRWIGKVPHQRHSGFILILFWYFTNIISPSLSTIAATQVAALAFWFWHVLTGIVRTLTGTDWRRPLGPVRIQVLPVRKCQNKCGTANGPRCGSATWRMRETNEGTKIKYEYKFNGIALVTSYGKRITMEFAWRRKNPEN